LKSKRLATAGLLGGVLMLGAAVLGISGGQNPPAPNTSASADDQGTFATFFAGHPLGTEKFNIRSSAGEIAAEAEIEMKVQQGGQTVHLKSRPRLVLTSQFEPQTYAVNQEGSQPFHLEVDFRASPAVSRLRLASSKQDDHRDFVLNKDVLILDDNVVHHYQLLVDRFALKPEKKQTFNAYIPQEAVPGVLEVEEVGPEDVEFAGRHETLRHLVVTTDLARIDLWVDGQQHLQRVHNLASQIEAVRTK